MLKPDFRVFPNQVCGKTEGCPEVDDDRYGLVAEIYDSCGTGCFESIIKARLFVTDIRFCRGQLMYTRLFGAWSGKRKAIHVRGKWCKGQGPGNTS